MAYLHASEKARPARRFTVLAMLGQMHDLARQRAALGRLDADLLRDINVSPQAAQNEANRPFWDAPAHWR